MRKIFLYFLLYTTTTIVATAQLPTVTQLLPDGLASFKPFGPGSPATLLEEVSVSGQSFTKALLINTFKKSATGEYGLNASINTPLKQGDVLWISFKSRSLESKRETGESFIEVRFDQLVNGKYQWPSHLDRGISIGANWMETSIPFVLKKDVAPEDARLVIKFDTYAQRFEIGPVTFINCGQNGKLSELPKSVVRYEGDAPDAAWRKAAAERIDKYRKGDLTVKVVDAGGKPVQGATVSLTLKKNAYAWGTATTSNNLLDTTRPGYKIYRDTLLKYFNKVVFENEVKAKNWSRANPAKTIAAVDWLKARNMTARGHVMVWPSWQHSPHLTQFQNDTAALRAAIIKGIEEQTTVLKNQFSEWDVVNEPYAHHNIIDSLGGKQVMVDWFKAARKNTPGVKLFLNDYSMFHTSGKGSEVFYENVKFLIDNGAPIEGIGEQSHIGGTPPGIPYILEKLDRFAAFNLPIQITEFDVTSDDEEFKARYIRDYFTAVFSHPSTTGILQWGFWEGQHWMPAAALWDRDWNIRPSGKVFTELVSKTWGTAATETSGKDGSCKIRGFTGEYEVTVTKGSKVVSQQTTLTINGQSVSVKF